jgi:hypothetical protein
MTKTNLKQIRSFIKMYDKNIQVDKYTQGPIPVVGTEKAKYIVFHRVSDKEKNVYYCNSILETSECVNSIVFDLPMNATPIEA